jgi:hypothetical protein
MISTRLSACIYVKGEVNSRNPDTSKVIWF